MSDITLNVIYVRHMYSCANYKKKNGSFFYWLLSDPSLHCIGIQQAKLLGKDFLNDNVHIDLIGTSQMWRAIQTGLIMRDIINPNIPIEVLPHINEKGITPDNVPEKFKSISGETAHHLKMTIHKNTDDKNNFKKFEETVLPNLLQTLIKMEKKKEYTIIIVTHSQLLKSRFREYFDNGQMAVQKYVFSKEGMLLDQKKVNPPKKYSPYNNNQFVVYKCDVCDNDVDLKDLNQIDRDMEIEHHILQNKKFELYKYKIKKSKRKSRKSKNVKKSKRIKNVRIITK